MLIATQSLQFPFPSSRCPIRQDLSWNMTTSLHFSPFTDNSATTWNSHNLHSCETHECSRLCWETIGTETEPSSNKLRQICFKHSQSWQHTSSQSLFQPHEPGIISYFMLTCNFGILIDTPLFVDSYCLNFCCNTYISRIGIT